MLSLAHPLGRTNPKGCRSPLAVEPEDGLIVRLPPRATTMRTGWSGLSRMKGNFQVRFLEGGGLATACLHSAHVLQTR